MICEKCGKVNSDKANRCAGCGFSFEAKRSKRRREGILVAAVLALIVAFTVGLGFFMLPSSGRTGFYGGGGGGGEGGATRTV